MDRGRPEGQGKAEVGVQALELVHLPPPNLGPKRAYGQRIPQRSHDLDICRSQGVHWKDKWTHLSRGAGTCSQV